MTKHAICPSCWLEYTGPGKLYTEPKRYAYKHARPCCFCGKSNTAGIDVRSGPGARWCQGWKGIHEDEDGSDD